MGTGYTSSAHVTLSEGKLIPKSTGQTTTIPQPRPSIPPRRTLLWSWRPQRFRRRRVWRRRQVRLLSPTRPRAPSGLHLLPLRSKGPLDPKLPHRRRSIGERSETVQPRHGYSAQLFKDGASAGYGRGEQWGCDVDCRWRVCDGHAGSVRP